MFVNVRTIVTFSSEQNVVKLDDFKSNPFIMILCMPHFDKLSTDT